jgi:hypothetical protein
MHLSLGQGNIVNYFCKEPQAQETSAKQGEQSEAQGC